MALEDTIAANTVAILALTAALNAGKTVNVTAALTPDPPGIAAAISAAAGAVAGLAASAAGQPALSAEASALASTTITEVLNAAAKLVATKGKPTLQDALKDYNAKSIRDIAPENLKAALDKINAALTAPAA